MFWRKKKENLIDVSKLEEVKNEILTKSKYASSPKEITQLKNISQEYSDYCKSLESKLASLRREAIAINVKTAQVRGFVEKSTHLKKSFEDKPLLTALLGLK